MFRRLSVILFVILLLLWSSPCTCPDEYTSGGYGRRIYHGIKSAQRIEDRIRALVGAGFQVITAKSVIVREEEFILEGRSVLLRLWMYAQDICERIDCPQLHFREIRASAEAVAMGYRSLVIYIRSMLRTGRAHFWESVQEGGIWYAIDMVTRGEPIEEPIDSNSGSGSVSIVNVESCKCLPFTRSLVYGPHGKLFAGSSLKSSNGHHSVTMQADCNLILRTFDQMIWNSGSTHHDPSKTCALVVLLNGNMAILHGDILIWEVKLNCQTKICDVILMVENVGNLVLSNADIKHTGLDMWASTR